MLVPKATKQKKEDHVRWTRYRTKCLVLLPVGFAWYGCTVEVLNRYPGCAGSCLSVTHSTWYQVFGTTVLLSCCTCGVRFVQYQVLGTAVVEAVVLAGFALYLSSKEVLTLCSHNFRCVTTKQPTCCKPLAVLGCNNQLEINSVSSMSTEYNVLF
jgi:hypothetical protein